MSASEIAPLLVSTATWNANSQLPGHLENWVAAPVIADIVAVGLQEMVEYDHDKSFDEQRDQSAIADKWEALIAASLPTHAKVLLIPLECICFGVFNSALLLNICFYLLRC